MVASARTGGYIRLAAVLAVGVTFAVDIAAAQTCSDTVPGYIIGSNSIQTHPNVKSAGDCCALCQGVYQCSTWTWASDSHTCFLKDNADGKISNKQRVSGTLDNGHDTWDACTMPNTTSLPFCDTSLPIDERVADLAARVPLESIGAQLTARESPAMPELGVPSYYWGMNAIHGLQNLQCLNDGQCPTSFAAPCGLSAAWNVSLVKEMGQILGVEARAYFNNRSFNSLDTWSPTINLNRDPRWGRNVESPGESPLLNGLYGSAYTEGLQQRGDGELVQAVVTLKHWIAYSVEDYDGVTRHTYDANVSAYDLANSFFPAFETTVKTGGALGVMCSYNELNGKPTCGNPDLTAVLREDWGFEGYMTSDSDAIADICNSHHYEPDLQRATRDGLEGGCDINSGNTYKDNLQPAVEAGLVNVSFARQALENSYRMRFRMGLFDPNVTNPYRSIKTDVVGSPAHQEASLRGARQSMVLLQNKDNFLPLPKGKHIALIGNSACRAEDLLGNYIGPICAGGGYACVPTLQDQITQFNAGGSVATLCGSNATDVGVVTAAAKAADIVVFIASNAEDGGGEGHDRTTINLDPKQQAAAIAAMSTDTPVAMVLINGGIIALDDLVFSTQAILEAFMPGTHGAQAVAETLFGANNPGGKMPVTSYFSNYTSQVDFLNMSMEAGPGRSYRYYDGPANFAFGFGLSYTTFDLSWSPEPPQRAVLASASDSTTYTCTVTNTGSVAGDEVVQAFYKPNKAAFRTLPAGTPVVLKELFGFQRVHLAPGKSTQVSFTLNATDVALVDVDGHRSLHDGEFEVELTRGHGKTLTTQVAVATGLPTPTRLSTFRRWW